VPSTPEDLQLLARSLNCDDEVAPETIAPPGIV